MHCRPCWSETKRWDEPVMMPSKATVTWRNSYRLNRQPIRSFRWVLDGDDDTIRLHVNSLAPGRFQFNFRKVIFKQTLVNGGWGISYEIALRIMPQDLTDDKSTLVQVMAWCRQATSPYLSQCWPRAMSPNGITRPQRVEGNFDVDGLVHCQVISSQGIDCICREIQKTSKAFISFGNQGMGCLLLRVLSLMYVLLFTLSQCVQYHLILDGVTSPLYDTGNIHYHAIRSSDNDSTGFWPPGLLHTLGADGHI